MASKIKTRIMTPAFRVAFPSVFKTKHNDLSGADEYSLVALFPKDADLSEIKKLIVAVATEKFGPREKWPKKMNIPLRNQADRANEEGKLPDGYVAGAYYLNLKSKDKPGVVDQSVAPIIDQSEFYGGCWAKASINCYAYSKMGNSGVAFGLGNVQKIKDDKPFGNRKRAEEEFSAVETSNEDSASDASGDSTDDLFG